MRTPGHWCRPLVFGLPLPGASVLERAVGVGHWSGPELFDFFLENSLEQDTRRRKIMSNIQCSGCGGVHPRPGGSRCRHLKEKNIVLDSESELDSDDETGQANPNSLVAWSRLLSPEEMASIPDRSSPEYMDLCERTISDLTKQLEGAKKSLKVEKAESTIANLMSKLKINPEPARDLSTGAQGRSSGTPTCSRGNPWQGDYYHDVSSSPSPSPGHKNVIEPSDSKEYLGRLRPEAHLVPVKNYEAMNYRELVLGMAGVHSHLLQHGRPVYGYEQHCLFVKRKSASFLYSNLASTLYDRYVTDKVLSGEFYDYPSSCSDAALEFFCDSYRRDNQVVSHNSSQSGKYSAKPWSGYPYPYCYFFNECNGCVKKSCSLKHECGYCHTPDHRSKVCSKSLWKKTQPSEAATPRPEH